MFRNIVHTLHPSLFYLLTAIIYLSFALITYYISTKALDIKRRDNDHLDEVTSISLSTINGGYSILLGFILLLVWENFHKALETVVDEGSKLTVIRESSNALPLPAAQKIQALITQYSQEVTQIEWPAMAHGNSSPQVSQTLGEMYTVMQRIKLETAEAQNFYTNMITALNEVMEKRNHRLSMINSSIPTAWYLFVFVVAFVIILLNSILLRRNRLQLCMHLLLVLVISFFLTAITALSYPFSGYISVNKEQFIHASILK